MEMTKEEAGKKTILLAEDDIFIGDIFETKLAVSGFQVVKVDNGEQVIQKLEEGVRPNLMLLDLRMPKLDGFGVLEKISQNEEWKTVPVVVLTNLSEDEDIDKCMKMGAVDFLVKSFFTPSEIMDKIEKHIQ